MPVVASMLMALVTAVLLAQPAGASSRVLRIGYEHSPPVQFVDREGRLTGPVREVISRAAERKGIRIEWVHCPEGPDRSLRSGRADLWPLIADLPQRRDHLTITGPYLRTRYWLVTRGNTGIRSLADTRGRQVLRQPGRLAALLARQYMPHARVEESASLQDSLSRVCRGDAESALVAQGTGDHLLLREQGCDVGQIEVIALPGVQLDFGIGARRGDTRAESAAKELKDGLITLFDEGEMAGIWLRWGLVVTETRILSDILSTKRYNRMLTLLALLLFVALAIAVWQTIRWRRAERAALAAADAKQAFLANMSHEIRTPMNGVLGIASLLEESSLNADQRDYVRTIRQSAAALLRLLNDVLDAAKMEAGLFRLVSAPFDLRETVSQVAHLAEPQARAKGLEWCFDWNPTLPLHWSGDGPRLRQILLNLVGNAVKFTREGAVGLRVDPSPGGVRIRVWDTGPGIGAELRSRLFEKFVQGEHSHLSGVTGSGLGLAISRSLVEQMGGSIALSSEPGRGSTFTVTLPLQPAPLPEPEPAPDASPGAPALPADNRRILVVEDNDVNQFVAQRLLGRLGCSVQVASDGESALRRLEAESFDLVLMDCGLPGIDGFETTRRLRARSLRTPIVAMTAAALDGDRERCLAAGMDDYLTKPLDLALLSRAVARWTSPEPVTRSGGD